MLTKNFYALQASICLRGGTYPATLTDGTQASLVFYHSGSSYYAIIFNTSSATVALNTTATGAMMIGSGTTPATEDDYALENAITSGFSTSGQAYVSVLEGGAEVVYKLVLKNTSASAFTVSEIGYLGRGYVSTSSSGAKSVMVDRTVLDAPVTIPAGESRTISYTVRLNWPV